MDAASCINHPVTTKNKHVLKPHALGIAASVPADIASAKLDYVAGESSRECPPGHLWSASLKIAPRRRRATAIKVPSGFFAKLEGGVFRSWLTFLNPTCV